MDQLTPKPEGQSPAPGNPAPTGEPTTTTEPQAQAAPGLTRDDLKSFASEIRDGIFADLRKAGVFGKQPKPTTKPVDGDVVTAPSTPQLDPLKLRALDRSLTKAGLAAELSQSQYERAERAFAAEAPDDVDCWVQDYFHGWKARPTPTPNQTVQQPVPAKPTNARPDSDRGAPAQQVPLVEADLVTMSESDRSALIREKGLPWFKGQLAKQLKGRAISTR